MGKHTVVPFGPSIPYCRNLFIWIWSWMMKKKSSTGYSFYRLYSPGPGKPVEKREFKYVLLPKESVVSVLSVTAGVIVKPWKV